MKSCKELLGLAILCFYSTWRMSLLNEQIIYTIDFYGHTWQAVVQELG